MIIREMAFDDISQVAEIERENSLTPWDENGLLTYLLRNDTLFLVASDPFEGGETADEEDYIEPHIYGYIGLLMVFNDIGMKELLTGSDAVENATKEALATALKSPDAQKIVADARKAAMTEVAYGVNTTSAEPKAATEAQETFRRFVRDTVLGVQKSVLEGEFNETQVEPAVKLFDAMISFVRLLTRSDSIAVYIALRPILLRYVTKPLM